MADHLHIKPSGRICLGEGLPVFQRTAVEALSAPQSRIYLELSAVTYIDSSGLGEIVKLYLEARKKGRKLVLVAVPQAIRKVLHSSKLDKVFPMADSIEAAQGIS